MPLVYRVLINKNILGDYYKSLQSDSKGVIVFLPGLPGYNHKNWLSRALAENGFDVIEPFYPGTWSSDGDFLPQSVIESVKDIHESIKNNNLFDLYNNQFIKLKSHEIHIMGNSFGTNVIQSSPFIKLYRKKILLGLVPTFNYTFLKDYPLDPEHFYKFLQTGFRNIYRCSQWSFWLLEFQGKGEFFNKNFLERKNVLIIQGQTDTFSEDLLKKTTLKDLDLDIDFIQNAGHSIDSHGKETLDKILKFLS